MLKNNTSLIAAYDRDYGFPIRVYDDGFGPLWLVQDEGGIRMIVRAQSFESAYEIFIDESSTISEDEVPEAYGFYGDGAALRLRQAIDRADQGLEEYPELVEGYQYQSNCSGTGIVDVSDYLHIRELTADDARERVRLVVRDCADEPEHRVRLVLESYGYTLAVDGRKPKRFRSFSVLSDVGTRLRKIERALGACWIDWTWEKQAT